MNNIQVAIDSPAAAGAGTQAKLIAKHYNLIFCHDVREFCCFILPFVSKFTAGIFGRNMCKGNSNPFVVCVQRAYHMIKTTNCFVNSFSEIPICHILNFLLQQHSFSKYGLL